MMDERQFLERAMGFQDGALSPDEIIAFENELRASPDRRRLFAEIQLRSMTLHERFRREAFQVQPEPTRITRFPRSTAWLAAAAALLLFAGLGWAFVVRSNTPVAHFGELEKCQWTHPDTTAHKGDGVRRGQRIELSAGTAEVVFACGAVTTLQGPCIFEVDSAKSAMLVLGKAKTVADAPEAKGFTLRTRNAKVVDLGTEFLTSAEADGQSHVEVSRGEVLVHLAGGGTPELLRKGDTLSLEPGSGRVMVRVERGDETPAFHFPSIEPPSDRDYADARQKHALIRIGSGTLNPDSLKHPQSGSGPVEVLVDGHGQSFEDAPLESVYFINETEGSLLLDLGKSVAISKINTYSWHQNRSENDNRLRAQQQYLLYGSAAEIAPRLGGSPETAGWELIARVNTDDYFAVSSRLDRPAQQACSISSPKGTLGRYRHLRWDIKGSKRPDFRAVNHTLYGEFDVYATP